MGLPKGCYGLWAVCLFILTYSQLHTEDFANIHFDFNNNVKFKLITISIYRVSCFTDKV